MCCVYQAMAAYRTAARLFPGLHLPLTGMGMEYQRMNNLHLAEQMFLQVTFLLSSQLIVESSCFLLQSDAESHSQTRNNLLTGLY